MSREPLKSFAARIARNGETEEFIRILVEEQHVSPGVIQGYASKLVVEKNRDVHTEHCCKTCGCKYGDPCCPVVNGRKKQSYPCKGDCHW